MGGGWRGGERLYLFIFFLGGEGGRETLLFCMYSNAFLCLPIHSYVFGKYYDDYYYYYDYYYQKKKHCISIPSSVFQFIRMSSNSFVCLLGGDGGWRAGMVGGGGERLYLFIFFSGGGGARNIIILYVFQCIRMSSNSFVCLRKKIEIQFIRMSSTSTTTTTATTTTTTTTITTTKKKHCISIPSSVFQFIRMSSNSYLAWGVLCWVEQQPTTSLQ